MTTLSKRPNTLILFFSILLTFIVLRIYLHFFPNTDFNVGRYNIHHLYSGIILVALGGVPLVLLEHDGRAHKIALVVFGIGLSMALDEWVFLIATDGTNASYSLPVSFWGGAILTALVCGYVGAVNLLFKHKQHDK